MKQKKVILCVSGSVAAYYACHIISLLKKEGINVVCVMTQDAQRFITALTLQSLSKNRVFIDMFEQVEEWLPTHTSLADSADLVLIAPATANIIGKLANGICDDLPTCVCVSTKAPIVVAPAMNDNMYANKQVQGNISRLKMLGYKFIGPSKGMLACGRVALGHIASAEVIVAAVKKVLNW